MTIPTIHSSLFDSAYIPNWQSLLRFLSEMALPESWTFKTAPIDKLRRDNLVLERYINAIFSVQVANMQHEPDRDDADQYFLIRSGYACFHTGLLTSRYKPIYCYLERNQDGFNKNWKLQGFYGLRKPVCRSSAHCL